MTGDISETDLDRMMQDPRGVFSEPQDVVADRRLSREQKLAILRRWELDALRLSTSESEGMGGGEDSMLSRVGNAIRAVADLP